MFKDGARYHGIGPLLKEQFGGRVVKVPIDGGFTCPNRDGTLGTGGCTFCSERGSGDFTASRTISITQQIDAQIRLLSEKWGDFRCIAYFQNFTNTYAPLDTLRQKYEEALSHPKCAGLAIATRPDCLPPDVLDYLQELNRKTFLWIELGLQTGNDRTAAAFHRGYPGRVYDDSVDRLTARHLRVVTHLIAGLPGETEADFLASVRHVCRQPVYGIKLQLLHIMKGTPLGQQYLRQIRDLSRHPESRKPADPKTPPDSPTARDAAITPAESRNFSTSCGRNGGRTEPEAGLSTPITPLTREEYVTWIADALEIIPPEITIHRLTGDAPEDLLLAPLWSRDKKRVLNEIRRELKVRGSIQGCRC